MSDFSGHSLPGYSPLPQRRHAVPARRNRRKSIAPLIWIILGILLFSSGYLLGTDGAAANATCPNTESSVSAALPPAADDRQEETTGDVVPEEGVAEAEWNLLLVNSEHPLPEDFQIPELTQLINGHAIDSRAYPALQRMMDAARAKGLQPLICSSFRSWDEQESLFSNKVQFYLDQGYSQTEAEEQAAFWVARPGTSEHQAGLAVDIVDMNYQLLDEQQEETPVQLWLMEHCAEYGFILRYPDDKSGLTGVGYEPWHYRYVGEAAAKEIMEQGICLEEYYLNIYG